MGAFTRSLATVAIGGAAVCLARLGGQALDARASRALADRAERRAHDAGQRAQDALDNRLTGLELTIQNAASSPRLAAALDGAVDVGTLRDIFATESWWARYRSQFEAYALATETGVETISGPRLPPAGADELVRRAQAGGAAAALIAGPDAPFAAAAGVIPLAARTLSPVLVVASRVSPRFLQGIAERAGGAVALSDGIGVVVGERREGEGAALRALAGREGEGPVIALAPGAAVAVAPVAPGVWLLTHAVVPQTAADARWPDLRKRLLWAGLAGAALFSGALLLRPRRRPARRGAPRTAQMLAPLSGAADRPPETLGRYILLDQIGEGGMAQVFTAVRIATGGFRRTLVIKRLRPELTSNIDAVAQFIDEANLSSQLVHSNIVPVFDFGKVGEQYYIAQEYIVGRDLGRVMGRVQQQGAPGLPLRPVLFAAHEVLSALEYAHNKRTPEGKLTGIVHRDITPGNVMVSARGEIKLLDFGIVKASEGRTTHTQIGLVKGSIGFMAPEQARGRDVDNRSDLFAVGLLIYYCVTGRALYEADTTYDLMVKAATGPGGDELARVAALPQPLPGLLRQALATDPGERFQTARAFADALTPHLGAGGEELAALVLEQFGPELQGEERASSAKMRVVSDEALVAVAAIG